MIIAKAWRLFAQFCAEWSFGAITVRLLCALLIGVVIGFDRGLKRRGAGIKTHALVCMGAALVTMTGQYMWLYTQMGDIARLPAQVISGISFLGVGTIVVTGRNQVRGLTTSAGLWVCACSGIACGIGFVDGALVTLALVIFTLKVLTRVDMLITRYSKVCDVYIEFENNNAVSLFMDEMRSHNVHFGDFELSKSKIKGGGPNAIINLEMGSSSQREPLLQELRTKEYIHYIEEL